jgi:hypothetical protein
MGFKRFVLINDKDGNEVLAEDLRNRSGINNDSNEEKIGGWLVVTVISAFLIEHYFLYKYFLILNNFSQPHWIFGILSVLLITYFLGIFYYFVPVFSYFSIIVATWISYLFAMKYFGDNEPFDWTIRIIVCLFFCYSTFIGNKFISLFGKPYQLLINECRKEFRYQNLSDAFPLRTTINFIRYKKIIKRFKVANEVKIIDLKQRIKLYGFNRGVELLYLYISSDDKSETNKIKRLAKDFNKLVQEKFNTHGENHEYYLPSWRPTQKEFIIKNQIVYDWELKIFLKKRRSDTSIKIYKGSHAYIGEVNSPNFTKPKIMLGENLRDVIQATIIKYDETNGNKN